jgi:hypothetical protein
MELPVKPCLIEEEFAMATVIEKGNHLGHNF